MSQGRISLNTAKQWKSSRQVAEDAIWAAKQKDKTWEELRRILCDCDCEPRWKIWPGILVGEALCPPESRGR